MRLWSVAASSDGRYALHSPWRGNCAIAATVTPPGGVYAFRYPLTAAALSELRSWSGNAMGYAITVGYAYGHIVDDDGQALRHRYRVPVKLVNRDG